MNRLVILGTDTTPANVVLSFNSITAVANYYGATSIEASLAEEFFGANYAGTATLMFTRFGLGQRPHLLGANISNLNLQSINGSLGITFDGYAYSGHVNLSGITSFVNAASKIRERAQFQFASRGRDDRKFDRAGIGFVHGICQERTALRHVGLVRHP